MNKKIMLLGGIVALVVGTFFVLSRSKDPQPTQDDNADRQKQFSWEFIEEERDETSMAPRTRVTLKSEGAVRELGTYEGTCSDISDSSWPLLENEKSGTICWWAGGGKEIGIFQEGEKLFVKVGDLNEGSEETAGFRGNFITLFELKPGSVPAIEKSSLSGAWQSIDDPKYRLELELNGRSVDVYDGEVVGQGTWEITNQYPDRPEGVSGPYLKVAQESEVYYYTIVENTPAMLVIIHLDRGNILRFTRI